MDLVFSHMPGESYRTRRQLRSFLCLFDVFPVPKYILLRVDFAQALFCFVLFVCLFNNS